MFVFDKRLNPEQAINFKSSSKAAFGWVSQLDLTGATAYLPSVYCADPSVPATPAATPGEQKATAATAVALLTRVRWNLGATDPIILEGLMPIALKQIFVGMLYASLTDIGITFNFKVFEYDPVSTAKAYYCCMQPDTSSPPPLKGKIMKEGGSELAIELDDNEELSIQDNSFYAFSMKIVPYGQQVITLASKSLAPITKIWGKTSTTP